MQLAFYTGTQFPAKYHNGAFLAFHGSWNRAPKPQKGYRVVFLPFNAQGMPTGEYETFADNFAGTTEIASPNDAAHRPNGVAVGPDGSLYVSDSAHGRVWRIIYTGETKWRFLRMIRFALVLVSALTLLAACAKHEPPPAVAASPAPPRPPAPALTCACPDRRGHGSSRARKSIERSAPTATWPTATACPTCSRPSRAARGSRTRTRSCSSRSSCAAPVAQGEGGQCLRQQDAAARPSQRRRGRRGGDATSASASPPSRSPSR